MKDYQEHDACLITGSKNLNVLKGYEKHYLVKSQPLGFVFCSRIPTESELMDHYKKYDRGLEVSEITLNRYRELLNQFKRYKKSGNILDVGCGMGHFLEVAREMGWNVYGTEFTQEAIDVCKEKGIRIFQGPLKKEWFEDIEFDVITSFEVIEHINNPTEDMEIISSILRSKGAFYCTTPNFNSIERRLLKSRYNIIQYPEHLCYYTKKTLSHLMAKFDLEQLWVRSTGISISRIKQGLTRNYENSNNSTNADEKIRESMQTNKLFLFLIQGINFFLIFTKTGNTLKGLYQKK